MSETTQTQIEFGTTRRATVLEVNVKFNPKKPATFITLRDDQGDRHTCIGTTPPCKVGDTGTLTFTDGGRFGGYWKFKRD